jgi:hypothetical protein
MKLSELIEQLRESAVILEESITVYGDRNVTFDPKLLKIQQKVLPNGDITIEVRHET